jgi:NosR/NirI family nitrous oxide reductase transcriptional regulator
VLRIIGWISPGYDVIDEHFFGWLDHYKWLVDVGLAGVVGYAVYFWYSGRVWCRFACPLAALMHIYARFSRFRIFALKSKCISCNVCTSVCHQGIDVMNFANKGLQMEDPECVRCSACVQSCPTGVLSFGRLDGQGQPVYDRLAASPVQMQESQEMSTSREVTS